MDWDHSNNPFDDQIKFGFVAIFLILQGEAFNFGHVLEFSTGSVSVCKLQLK